MFLCFVPFLSFSQKRLTLKMFLNKQLDRDVLFASIWIFQIWFVMSHQYKMHQHVDNIFIYFFLHLDCKVLHYDKVAEQHEQTKLTLAVNIAFTIFQAMAQYVRKMVNGRGKNPLISFCAVSQPKNVFINPTHLHANLSNNGKGICLESV